MGNDLGTEHDAALTDRWRPSRRGMLQGLGGLATVGALGATAVESMVGAEAASGSPSGQAMPKGNLPGWKQVIAEDFATSIPRGGFVPGRTYGLLAPTCSAYQAYGKRLGVYGDGPVNTYGYYDARRTLSTSGSLLDMYLHIDPTTGRRVSAAVTPFRPGRTDNAHLYGRWSYRMRSFNATGSNWACVSLLWPQKDADWPRSGEIDWPEGNVRALPAGTPGRIEGFVHPRGASTGWDGTIHIPGRNGLWTNWHTFTIEWRPNSLKVFLDKVAVMSTTARVPNTPMRWVTQSGPSNDERGRSLRPSGSAHVQIDWVVAYDPA